MATTAGSGSSSSDLLRSERIAGGILPKVLNSFDMVAIFVAIVLFITNTSSVSGAGPAVYIYWMLGFLTFLIPGAIVTGQLGLMFPGEGSIYVWTNKAFGPFMGFFAGFCAWWPGVLVMIATGDVVMNFIVQLGSLFNVTLLAAPWQQGVVIIAVIALSCALSVLRFRVTQNFVNILFLAYVAAVLLIGLAGVLWLASGGLSQTDFRFASGGWGLNGTNYTFYGAIILALLGIEVPLNMGVEVKNVRSITRYLLWGSVVVMAAYLIVTFSVLVSVPTAHQADLTGIAEAAQFGFSKLGGFGTFLTALVTLMVIGFFIFTTTVYNYSFGRLLFVSGLDRRLPAAMSRVNANKVPWFAIVVQTVISAIFTAIAFIVIPLLFNSANLATINYNVLQAAVTVIWCVSMVILFIDVIIIRFKYRDTFSRIQLAPDWVFYLCAAFGLLASAFGIYVVFTASWVSSLLATNNWDLWIGGIAIVSLIVGVIVFFIGQAAIKSDVTDEEVIAEVTG